MSEIERLRERVVELELLLFAVREVLDNCADCENRKEK